VGDDDPERGERRDDEAAIQLALFRYGVIGPLVEREQYEPGEVTRLVAEIAAATHYLPGTGAMRIGRRTIYTWLRRHRRGGIAALRPYTRKDRGTRRVATDEVLARAVTLRKEQPGRKTKVLLDILVHEGTRARRCRVARRSTGTCDVCVPLAGIYERWARSARSRCASRNLVGCGWATTTTVH
jgi:hypothetical protein